MVLLDVMGTKTLDVSVAFCVLRKPNIFLKTVNNNRECKYKRDTGHLDHYL
jgi:hypothetical protein